ncbi:MAG: VOC family protein [Bacteroidia bacterium]|nr:VOC family protein [Bacteroidia bacterium]MBT8310412.1 VOC family protein [Bacteroidia bacterium]NNK28377.1 VOC family protein [Flavobacteriaceae bacterium]NNL59865.1 VOC family protein [Flavobacteriaceae bacterium]RZV67852.1 MAG: VOC family protein [Flavobacteriaceae bacterium]
MNLNQVTIPSINVVDSISFYQKLGLSLIVKALPHYARFEAREGNSTLSIHEVDEIDNGEGIILYFEREDLDNYVEKLINKGIEFDELPEDKAWLWREAKLKDPDGNRLIIYFAGDNRKNPPWRIKEA